MVLIKLQMEGELDISKFEIVANISKTIKKMLNHVDRYQINFHIDFTYNRLIMVGISPNKSKLVALISSFTALHEDLQGKTYFNFVCKIPEFQSYNKFKIVKDGDSILMGDDSITKAVFYEEELYTDWSGTGESVYDHCIEINSSTLKNIIDAYNYSSEIKFKIGTDRKIFMDINGDQHFLGSTTKSKKGFDNVNYSIIFEDLEEVLEEENTKLQIFFNKDCPVLIKKKSEQESIKKSYVIYALI